MSREDLRHKLAEVEKRRGELEEAVRSVRDRVQSIETLRRDMHKVWYRFHQGRELKLQEYLSYGSAPC